MSTRTLTTCCSQQIYYHRRTRIKESTNLRLNRWHGQNAAVQCLAAARKRGGRIAAAQGFAPPKETGSVRKLAKEEQVKIADKLINAFQSKPQSDWRKLIAFSKQWPQLADSVFARTDEKITAETDPETKLKLRRFLRGLKNAHADVTKYREFYSKFVYADESEFEAIVAGNEDTLMSAAFFDFLGHIATAAADDPEEQERIIVTGNRIAAIHEAYAQAADSDAQLAEAHQKLQDVLQVETLEEADQKIDKMAAEGKIDPAFLLTMAKAYSGVKETDMVQEEVKDIMYHLYMKAKEATERGAPPEVRILKHLISISDPQHRAAELENSFKPGDLTTEKEDFLSTTPRLMLATVETVIGAYEGQKGKTSMLGQTADLMDPEVIERMRDVRTLITNKYL